MSTDTRYLIVNGDDFGRIHGINRGTFTAHQHGIVTSASLMACWPAAREGVAFARAGPALGLGLHLDPAEWIYDAKGWQRVDEVVDHTDTASPLSIALLELHHRQHARVEDRTGQAEAAGLRNVPCKEVAENHARLQCVLAANDLVCWSKLICFSDEPVLAHCEVGAVRYRILHMAAMITRGGRVVRLRLDRTRGLGQTTRTRLCPLRAEFAGDALHVRVDTRHRLDQGPPTPGSGSRTPQHVVVFGSRQRRNAQ